MKKSKQAKYHAQCQQALDTFTTCDNEVQAAELLGISRGTLQGRLRAAKRLQLAPTSVKVDMPDEDAHPLDAALEELRRTKLALNAANADLRKQQKANDTAEAIRTEIFGLAAHTPAPPAWVDPVKSPSGKRGVPCTIWSDWHFGEVVNPDEVGGVNEFSTDIAKKRVKRLVDTTIDLSFNHMGRAKTDYPGVVICLGGDMMTGDIHEEIVITNDRTPQQQVNDLTDTLAGAIDRMATAFGKAFVPCVVGNHGRDTRKPRMKQRVFTSHEWVVYTNLERHFRKSKHVAIHVPGESDAYFKVFGHRYLLTHGDSLGVKGGDGIIGALGPIMRGRIKTAASEAHIGRDFDTMVIGHWHQGLYLPGCIVNGALKGYDEFARLVLRAPYSRPSQQLWFTHPQHGITARWEVYLEGRQQASAQNEWVSWQQRKAA